MTQTVTATCMYRRAPMQAPITAVFTLQMISAGNIATVQCTMKWVDPWFKTHEISTILYKYCMYNLS